MILIGCIINFKFIISVCILIKNLIFTRTLLNYVLCCKSKDSNNVIDGGSDDSEEITTEFEMKTIHRNTEQIF